MNTSRFAVIVHGVVMSWLLINGLGHTAQVLWKARAGTLTHPEDLEGLLTIGAGLLLAGAAYVYGLGGLMRREQPSLGPALAALAVLGGVIVWTERHYGFAFLRGTIALAVLHAIAMIAFAIKFRV